ncbi:WUSCHEL-related homeobox 11-like isoform X2 [Carex littledalei]|uniref:WUSCHEL-related homeobox 11-like isoform X2 n=1 Tax=Carex littledalei TaxID=544730 RepID=A0A833QPS7_9POAL|nr:WUSCHEL-related homeobox 11-like isoform X2 [Carex littledalei]
MVNPPKEETVRIRKLLEKFGAVRDANVFYWFQNRRSRSRRRQRQQQTGTGPQHVGGYNSMFSTTSSRSCSSSGSGNLSTYCNYNSSVAAGAIPTPAGAVSSSSLSSNVSSFNPSISRDDAGDDLFAISRQFGLLESEHSGNSACSSDLSQLHYQPTGTITVFINGVAWDVPRGPIDMRSMFGHDAMLVHSSGELLPVNEYGFLMKGLHLGESYFLYIYNFVLSLSVINVLEPRIS